MNTETTETPEREDERWVVDHDAFENVDEARDAVRVTGKPAFHTWWDSETGFNDEWVSDF